MTEERFKKMIRTAIESFPINGKRKEELKRKVRRKYAGKKNRRNE